MLRDAKAFSGFAVDDVIERGNSEARRWGLMSSMLRSGWKAPMCLPASRSGSRPRRRFSSTRSRPHTDNLHDPELHGRRHRASSG